MGETFHCIFNIQFSFFYLGDGGCVGQWFSFFNIQFGFELRMFGFKRLNPISFTHIGYPLISRYKQNG